MDSIKSQITTFIETVILLMLSIALIDLVAMIMDQTQFFRPLLGQFIYIVVLVIIITIMFFTLKSFESKESIHVKGEVVRAAL